MAIIQCCDHDEYVTADESGLYTRRGVDHHVRKLIYINWYLYCGTYMCVLS